MQNVIAGVIGATLFAGCSIASAQGVLLTGHVQKVILQPGEAGDEIRQFNSRIGEWGASFPVTDKLIVVSEEAGNVSWSLATERDGRIFFDPKRLRSIRGVPTSPKDDSELVALDEVLARSSTGR
jgi:hypothetical protein